MAKMPIYRAVAKFGMLNYRVKLLLMAFLGTHIPLLGIIAWSVLNLTRDPALIWGTLGVALAATLAGTGVTLLILNGLLQPVFATSKALRTYRETREIADLPTGYTDEAGTLMSDAKATLDQLDATIVQLETTDAVTGLGNRVRYLDVLAQKMAQPVGVAVIRLGNLQQIVASFDQTHADMLARQIAGRLRQQVAADGLARIDSDAFAFIVPGENPDAHGAEIARVLSAIGKSVTIGGMDSLPNLQAGLAAAPRDGTSPEAVLDAAVAAARMSGVNAVTRFTPKAREDLREAFVIEQELRGAIASDQLVLHFQPVVDIASGKAVSAEALVRWQHPERGLIAPARFIPIAERSGLIDDLGLWVLNAACRQMADWDREGLDPLKVAVNVSPRQFLDPRLHEQVRSVLSHTGIDPARLELELTESAAMLDYEHTLKTFGAFKDMGLSVAIDDFGTGFASMSQLRKLPFDKLKIDREFVTNVDTAPDAQAICNAVIALSDGLGLDILAEGTERRQEVDYLAERGCSLFQGFYFSKPVAAPHMAEVLADLAHMAADRSGGASSTAARHAG